MNHPLDWTIRISNPTSWAVPNLLQIKMPLNAWLFWFMFSVVMLLVIPAGFFWLAEPSLLGNTDWRWWCDSPVFLYVAGVDTDPALLQADYQTTLERPPGGEIPWSESVTFVSNYIGPLLIGVLAGTNFKIMLVNYAIFLSALWLLFRLKDVRGKLLTLLILVNPFTIISIWTVNKEIIALLAVALFAYYLEHRRWFLLPIVLAVSFLARWEQAAFVVVFLLVTSRLNPLRKYRFGTLLLLVVGISAVYPSVHSLTLGWGEPGHTMAVFNALQEHYLFFLAVIPKLLMNTVFGFLVALVQHTDWHDIPNGIGMLAYQALMVGVAAAVLVQRKLRLASNYVYSATIFAVICCAAPFVQPRYLYAAYIFMCIELATCRKREPYVFEPALEKHVGQISLAGDAGSSRTLT